MRTANAHISSIEKKANSLPLHLVKEVEDFIDFLLKKNNLKAKESHKLNQKWAGALKHYKNKYTSIELQKLALNWR